MEEWQKFAAPKVPKQCPLVLLVNVFCWQGKTLGSEGSSVMGSGLFRVQGRKEA